MNGAKLNRLGIVWAVLCQNSQGVLQSLPYWGTSPKALIKDAVLNTQSMTFCRAAAVLRRGLSFLTIFLLHFTHVRLGMLKRCSRYLARFYPDITFKVDVRLDYSLDDRQVVDEIMRKADHVSVTTFASHRFDLVDMDYKAKVTFVATGDCTAPCGTTMCDDYAFVVPSNIVTAPIQLLASINIARGHVIGQDRFDYFLEANGTLIGLDHFEESRCIYGDDVLAAIGAPLCGATAIKHSQACS
ncbi:hypothetical protein FOZ60_012605 [Perkinsus olseni]|uniref:Uncharacterized protein n=1 Tax=Perkinsus olseni TaxID=32597 RepID=A0A7J6NBE1_PEROL|nr:hypothetical protein FOZ60_012605 [Perkinsus olseni]